MAKFKLDEVDHQILDMLIENTRIPFTDIAKKLLISAGTVHVRVKKMEEAGIIIGSSLSLDYAKLGYSFGKFNIFCKIRARDTNHAKNVIFQLDDIEGVYRTETMISLEESINDKKRLMHSIFQDLI